MIFEDQLAALEADSKKVGTQGGEIDFALLVDGLAAEREQGITIDVAYRFFSTDRRKFIVADTPGPRAVHAQHGHRRLDRRPRRDPDRRAQGRADADPPPQLPRVAARHPPRRAGGQQDGPGRLLAGASSTRSSPTTARSPRRSASTTSSAIPISALQRRQHHRPRARTRPGTTARRCSSIWRPSRSTTTRLQRGRSACRCSGSTGPNLDFRGFAGLIAGGTRAARATASASLPSGRESTRRAHRHHRRRPRPRPSPASRSR